MLKSKIAKVCVSKFCKYQMYHGVATICNKADVQVSSLMSLVRWGKGKQCKVTAVADSHTYNSLIRLGSVSSSQWLEHISLVSPLHSVQSHSLSNTARNFAALVKAAQLLAMDTRFGYVCSICSALISLHFAANAALSIVQLMLLMLVQPTVYCASARMILA
jgi:hypothetical protein